MAQRLRSVYTLAIKTPQAPDRAGRLVHVGLGLRDGDLFDYAGLVRYTAAPSSGARRSPPTPAARRYQGCSKTAAGRCR